MECKDKKMLRYGDSIAMLPLTRYPITITIHQRSWTILLIEGRFLTRAHL